MVGEDCGQVLVREARSRDDTSISVIATVEREPVQLLDDLAFGSFMGRIIRIEAYGFVFAKSMVATPLT